MGFGKWILRHGPGSPGQLTRDISKNYLLFKQENLSLDNKFYFRRTLNLHFLGQIPPGSSTIIKSLNNVGPKYHDLPSSFFDELIEKTEGYFFPFVVIYVMLYNRGSMKHVINSANDLMNVIEEEYTKLIPTDYEPLQRYRFQIQDVYSYILSMIT